jgi:hypothetical protein
LFTFAPTFIELLFVVGLLANRFSPMVAVLVGCTFALYVAWTLSMTQVCRRVVQRCSSHVWGLSCDASRCKYCILQGCICNLAAQVERKWQCTV